MKYIFLIFSKVSIEVKIILLTLAILIILPALTVVVLASSGASILGQALASVNPITHLVEIFDADGNKVHELELSTAWPMSGYISDEFGTLDPVRRLLGLKSHMGIDISNKVGTPVTTFMTGTVTAIDNIDDSSCGKTVRIDHNHGITSLYCHLDQATVLPGSLVNPGDLIGYMGNTGTSTGPHLHFQIMVYGIAVNPRTFMVGEPVGAH